MLKDKTVFVLGAGMSSYYGFPLGDALSRMILKHCVINDHVATRLFLQQKGIKEESFKNFTTSYTHSGCKTIDQFMAANNTNEEFHTIGKYFISKILLGMERKQQIFPDHNTTVTRINPYLDIWNKLLFPNGKINNNPDSFFQQPISFISFNYDRSLDYFLYNVIKEAFKLKGQEIFDHINKLPVYRVYGSLMESFEKTQAEGPGKFDDFTCLAYGGNPIEEQILGLSKNINFMRYVEDDEYNFRDLLKQAKNIVFLGYGFDDYNNNKLGLTKIPGIRDKNIYASCFGLSSSRKAALQKLIFQKNVFVGEKCEDVIEYSFLEMLQTKHTSFAPDVTYMPHSRSSKHHVQ